MGWDEMSGDTASVNVGVADDEVDEPERRHDLGLNAGMDGSKTTSAMDEPLPEDVVDELEEPEMMEERDEPGPTTPDTDELGLKNEPDEPEPASDGIQDPGPATDLDEPEPKDEPDETDLPKPKTRKRKKKGNKKKRQKDRKRAEIENIQKKRWWTGRKQLVHLLIAFFLAALSLLLCWFAFPQIGTPRQHLDLSRGSG